MPAGTNTGRIRQDAGREWQYTECRPILGSLGECLGVLELGPDCSTQSKISKVWLAL